jgi:hypothetical protein
MAGDNNLTADGQTTLILHQKEADSQVLQKLWDNPALSQRNRELIPLVRNKIALQQQIKDLEAAKQYARMSDDEKKQLFRNAVLLKDG